jgi:hypothetical protein
VDLKISKPDEDRIDKYKTQLTAYKFALENPKFGNTLKITRIGLLVFYPDTVSFADNSAYLGFPPKWLEVPIDESGFFEFMKQIDTLLTDPLPEESKTCKWCLYRHVGEKLSHSEEKNTKDIPF